MENLVRTNKYYKQNNSDRKQIRFGDLLIQIDESRGGTPLSEWVKSACKEKIERDKNKGDPRD